MSELLSEPSVVPAAVTRSAPPVRTARAVAEASEPPWLEDVRRKWERAGHHAVVALERRADRRFVVARVMAEVDPQGPPAALVVADDHSASQWRRHLAGQPSSASPQILTAKMLLADSDTLGTRFSILLLDEAELYLSRELAAAVASHEGPHFALYSNPNEFARAETGVKRVLGPLLLPESTLLKSLPWTLPSVIQEPSPDVAQSDEDLPETREKLVGVGDPSDLLGRYLGEIQKAPLLTPEEEVTLARAIEAGVLAAEALENGFAQTRVMRSDLWRLVEAGQTAKERFIVCNLRLVFAIARKYSRRMDILDVIQEGNIGLQRAVQKFDHQKGFKFSTYATWWINQAITRAVADQSLQIRLPAHVHEKDQAVMRVVRQLRRDGEVINVDFVAKESGVANDVVRAVIARHTPPISLEDLIERLGDLHDENYVDPSDLVDEWDRERLVSGLLSGLGEREADILARRHGLVDGRDWTLDEIGKLHGVTRERIRQIESLALKNLRFRLGLSDQDPNLTPKGRVKQRRG